MGTTPHPPLHTIMQQWDAKPAPRTFPSLRPATTPRWSGTSGPSPTRRSLLCENNFNYTWILGKCKRKLFVKGNGQYPSGLVNSASPSDPGPSVAPRHLPTLWGVPHFVGRLSRGQCPEGLCPFAYSSHVSLFKTYSSGRNPRRQSASARPCAGAHRQGGSRSGHGACGSACPSASGTARRCPPG